MNPTNGLFVLVVAIAVLASSLNAQDSGDTPTSANTGNLQQPIVTDDVSSENDQVSIRIDVDHADPRELAGELNRFLRFYVSPDAQVTVAPDSNKISVSKSARELLRASQDWETLVLYMDRAEPAVGKYRYVMTTKESGNTLSPRYLDFLRITETRAVGAPTQISVGYVYALLGSEDNVNAAAAMIQARQKAPSERFRLQIADSMPAQTLRDAEKQFAEELAVAQSRWERLRKAGSRDAVGLENAKWDVRDVLEKMWRLEQTQLSIEIGHLQHVLDRIRDKHHRRSLYSDDMIESRLQHVLSQGDDAGPETSPAAAARETQEPQKSKARMLRFKMVDAERSTPLHGVTCKAKISKQGSPAKLRSLTTDSDGIVQVEVAEDEWARIVEAPSGWFISAPLVTVIERVENGIPKHVQAAVNDDEPTVVKLWQGTDVKGRLLWPDKTPAAGVHLTAGVYVHSQSWMKRLGLDLVRYSFDHGDWPNWSRTITTDNAGRFRVTVPPPDARLWFRIGTTTLSFGPQVGHGENEAVTQRLAKCVPLEIQYGGNAPSGILAFPDRTDGDPLVLPTGDLQLQSGVIVRGRVVDANGKGLSDVVLTTKGPHGPHSGRTAISGDDGKFAFPAMQAGSLTVNADARERDVSKPQHEQVISREVQAVFVEQTFTIPDTDEPYEITVRAVPHTELVFQWVDRREDKTHPVAYYGTFRIRGYMPDEDGKPSTYWTGETKRIKRNGKSLFVVKVPTALLKPELILPADRFVTASYSDSTGVTSGSGIVPLGDISADTTRTIFGNEPRKPADSD